MYMRAFVFFHVDQFECSPRGAQRALQHGVRRPDEGVDGAVGGIARGNVQQGTAVSAANRVRYGVDHGLTPPLGKILDALDDLSARRHLVGQAARVLLGSTEYVEL